MGALLGAGLLGALALGASVGAALGTLLVVLQRYPGQPWSQIAVTAMLRAMPNSWFSYDFAVFDRSGTPSRGQTYRTSPSPRRLRLEEHTVKRIARGGLERRVLP